MNTRTFKISSDSPEETLSVGYKLGSLLSGGEIVGLIGDLGAGKTCFIQGIARGLDVAEKEYVRSPTFTLINEYRGRVPLYHFDLYRLRDEQDLLGLGYEEYFYSKGVTVVEWFERIGSLLPEQYLKISIAIVSETQRELHFSCKGVYYKQKLESFRRLFLKGIK